MSVLTIGELKARFAAGDQPSEKDFIDLIDTLVAGVGATPSGPAGGDLSGTFPNPTIANESVTLAKLQNINTSRLLGRATSGVGDVEELEIGTGLAIVGDALTSTAGGGGTTPNVSGSVINFTSTLTDMPGADGIVTIAAPTEFGNSMPQAVRVVAKFRTSFAGYVADDEVPLEFFRIRDDPETPALTYSVALISGQVTVKVRVEYGTFGAGPFTGIAVYSKTDLTYPPIDDDILVPFEDAGDVNDKIGLKVYLTRSESGTGFGSITKVDPATQALPAASAVATFTHNFGIQPDLPVRVTLQCIAADSATDHAIGDEVPIDEAYETGFANPAFGVSVNNTTVLVRREATTIVIPHKTTAALTALTGANWKIRVVVYRTTNVPTLVFPATSFIVSRPIAAFSYGERMYVWHLPYEGTTMLSRINLTNGVIVPIRPYSGDIGNVTVRFHRFDNDGDPVDCLVYSCKSGFFRLNLADDTEDKIYPNSGTADVNGWVPVAFSEAGNGGFEFPDFISCFVWPSNTPGYTYTSHLGKRWTRSVGPSATYAAADQYYVDWTNQSLGSTFDAYHSLSSLYQYIVFFAYNPVKRRIYLMDINSLYLFVFKFTSDAHDLFEWWDTSPATGLFTFEKAIAVPGSGPDGYNHIPRIAIEFDGVTGAERSITYNTWNPANIFGQVTRVPWVE